MKRKLYCNFHHRPLPASLPTPGAANRNLAQSSAPRTLPNSGRAPRWGLSFWPRHWVRERERTLRSIAGLGTKALGGGLRVRGGTPERRSGEEGAPRPQQGRSGQAERPRRTRYLQGFVQVPAGLVQGLLGRVSRVAHSFQRVYVLQPASFLLFFLFPYLGQFL